MSLSSNLVLQWFAALALICGAFALDPFHALAKQATNATNLTPAKSASRNLVENDGEVATSQLSAPVPATTHEDGDDHRHAQKGSVVQVNNIAELKEHVVAGINTKKHGATFPTYLDKEQVSNLAIVGRRALPSTVLVDADGLFHRLALGKLDWDYPNLTKLLMATVARKPVVGNGAKVPAK